MKRADQAKTSAANMKRAERFNLGNHGPALTAVEEQEVKRKKLESVAKKLEISFGCDFTKVVPSLCAARSVEACDGPRFCRASEDVQRFELKDNCTNSSSKPVRCWRRSCIQACH